MKIRILFLVIFTATYLAGSTNLSAIGLQLPSGNEGIEDTINQGAEPEFTNEELAEAPPGEIQKLRLRDMKRSLLGLEQLIASIPEGVNGRQSPYFTKLQTIKDGIGQVVAQRSEALFFSLIPMMIELFEAEDAPEYVIASIEWLQNLSSAYIYSIAKHAVRQNANVEVGTLKHFVELFSFKQGFIFEGDWENEPMPINAAGVMILDAVAVVTELKAGQWRHARQFLGGETTASGFFSRYVPDGDGLAVLKTKYSQNKAMIDAKFLELKNWVAEQEAANGE